MKFKESDEKRECAQNAEKNNGFKESGFRRQTQIKQNLTFDSETSGSTLRTQPKRSTECKPEERIQKLRQPRGRTWQVEKNFSQ